MAGSQRGQSDRDRKARAGRKPPPGPTASTELERQALNRATTDLEEMMRPGAKPHATPLTAARVGAEGKTKDTCGGTVTTIKKRGGTQTNRSSPGHTLKREVPKKEEKRRRPQKLKTNNRKKTPRHSKLAGRTQKKTNKAQALVQTPKHSGQRQSKTEIQRRRTRRKAAKPNVPPHVQTQHKPAASSYQRQTARPKNKTGEK